MKECSSRADDRGGQERDQHADDEAARRRIGERAERDLPQPLEVDRQDRQDRAELDQHHEGLAEIVVAEAEEMLQQQQVPGRRHGEEFGEALDHAEHDGLDQIEQHVALRARRGAIRPEGFSRRAGQGATEKVAACRDAGGFTFGAVLSSVAVRRGRISAMITLFHHPFCPHSRFVRLVLGEFGLDVEVRRGARVGAARGFPQDQSGRQDAGADRGRPPGGARRHDHRRVSRRDARAEAGERRLLPADPAARVEVRRLASWFHDRFFDEVSGFLVTERIYKQTMRTEQGGGPPDTSAIRAARHNIRYHLAYIGWLARQPHLARGRTSELCGSGGGRASVGCRLSGRCAVDRGRSRKDLVRAGEVAALVPAAAGRSGAGDSGRRRPTRIWISERRRQGGAARGRARARLRRGRRDAAGRDPAGEAATSSASSPKASTATWTGSPRRPRGAPIRRCCGRMRVRS